MKRNLICTITMSALVVTLNFSSVITAYAESSPERVILYESGWERFEDVSPRYSYIQSIDLGVYPSDAEAKYNLYIRGTSDVTKASGTLTLYKQNANGEYEEKESVSLEQTGSKMRFDGSFNSYGPGNYKVEFSGTVYTKSGSEPVTIRNYNSY